jgi:hypothetical protein
LHIPLIIVEDAIPEEEVVIRQKSFFVCNLHVQFRELQIVLEIYSHVLEKREESVILFTSKD